jgi:CarboxypepD_reg-like domain
MKSVVCILVFVIVFGVTAHPQSYISVSGKVKSKINNSALSNANISLKNYFIGTTTNIYGEFIFTYPESYNSDTLVISYLGFKSLEVPISEIKDSIQIQLSPKKFLINEVLVLHKNPEWIIQNAINKIPENYHTKPYNLQAFYRENIREDNEEIQFAEAVLEIYKGNTSNSSEKDRLKLLKGRTKPGLKRSILWQYIRFVDGPYDLLKADVAKNPKSFFSVSQNKLNFLQPKFFKYYNYTLLESFDLGDELYAIQFMPKENKKWALYDGTIFIDKKNFAIKGVEYKFNVEKINLASILDYNTQLALEDAGALVKAVDFYCFVEYKPYEDKWIYSQATMKYNFVFNEKITKDLFYITAHTSMVVTNIRPENIEKISFKDQLKFRTTLKENIKDIDSTYWENFNYIQNEKTLH